MNWLPIPGYEFYYDVSDVGLVRSVDRLIIDKLGRSRFIRGQLLSPKLNKRHGYLEVTLHLNGVTRCFGVHQLVMLAFVGPPLPGHEVRHADRIRTHNSLDNLSYGTRSDNKNDAVAHGSDHNTSKTHCPREHLLIVPNLVDSLLPYRICKSCNRASSKINYERDCGRPLPDLQELSDYHYARIMPAEMVAAAR